MRKQTKQSKPRRYSIMSVPGRREDGSDTSWFVWDATYFRTVTRAASFDEARHIANEMNNAPAK